MQTTNKVTTIATLLKCHSGLLYLSLFFFCTVISDLPYDINMFLIDLFLLLFTQRTNSQSGLNKFCDDAFTLNEALNQCPSHSGSPFPRYKARCKVEIESCAWFVDCPGTAGAMFRVGQAGARAKQYRLTVENDMKITCGIQHRQWAFVCCGYYCY